MTSRGDHKAGNDWLHDLSKGEGGLFGVDQKCNHLEEDPPNGGSFFVRNVSLRVHNTAVKHPGSKSTCSAEH